MNASDAAIAAARNAGLRVVVAPLGVWRPARLLAEYDRAGKSIRVDAPSVERLRALGGDGFADGFIACAVWHELHHHHHPDDDEAAAHAFARARCGTDPETFAALLRPEARR
jgi:hypothetical protein